MSIRWDILGVGSAAVDDLVYVSHYPRPDTKQPIQAARREGGGLTATALVAATRLGARTAYAAALGDDELSRFTVQELERAGVDCSPVRRLAWARPYHAVIIVDQSSGQRTILYSGEGVTPLPPTEITEALIAACRVLFVDNRVVGAGLRAIELAQAQGIPVVGDMELELGPGDLELLARLDHLLVGLELAGQVTGETEPEGMVRALAGGRACTVVTAGERGCWYAEGSGPVQHVPAYAIQAVDTTGCGDVFHGAYAACLAQGENVNTTIRVASAAAALKATQPGGRSGIPDRAKVEQFLSSQRL